jgi:hypothetical protein
LARCPSLLQSDLGARQIKKPRPRSAGDARERKFLWPDAGQLDLEQSVRRINQQYPNFPEQAIKEFLIDWFQELYVPEGYSESQMDELERLTERWAADLEKGEN